MVGQININQFAGLQALYHLLDVNDSSGNARNLTNTNSVVFLPGGGADFGASNTNKLLLTSDRLGIDGGACTYLFTLKLQSEIGSSQWSLFEQRSNQTSKSRFQLTYEYNAGTPRLYASRIRAGVAQDDTSKYTISLGTTKKYILAYVYDDTNMFVYINGDLVASGTSSGNGVSAIANEGFAVGGNTDNSLNASAIFKNFLVTNTALTQRQIKEYTAWALGRRTTVA